MSAAVVAAHRTRIQAPWTRALADRLSRLAADPEARGRTGRRVRGRREGGCSDARMADGTLAGIGEALRARRSRT